jgi:putative transposase
MEVMVNLLTCPGAWFVFSRVATCISRHSVAMAGGHYLDRRRRGICFQLSLEAMRVRYGFPVIGYVVMPEHVHLLVTESDGVLLAAALKALKISVAVQRRERPFWQARYYDFNVFTERKRVEKLRYLHRNPVTRGLVGGPADWKWSSYRHYWTGERVWSRLLHIGMLRDWINGPTSQKRDMGHPFFSCADGEALPLQGAGCFAISQSGGKSSCFQARHGARLPTSN